MSEKEPDQLTGQLALMPDLVRARARKAKQRAVKAPGRQLDAAEDRPVASVLVDLPLAHLDRPFDYLVPQKMAEAAVPGARVKVRFAGQEVAGFVLGRADKSDHGGTLAELHRVVSPEPVLAPAIARLSGSIAARYAGTRSDVLRLAVPHRHATVEKQPCAFPADAVVEPEAWERAWSSYSDGHGLVSRLAAGQSPRAVWSAVPGEDWAHALAEAAAATYSSGRGVVLCLPDRKDVARVDAALTTALGAGHHVVLTADLGPAARYRAFLTLSRGALRVVVGTRAAAFAPVKNVGLLALWDDGDDLYADPHAPYPHTREVLLLRAQEESCAVLVAGFARTVEAQHLVATGWAEEITAAREVLRAAAQVSITGATEMELARDPFARSARLPKLAHDAIRDGLRSGPVLVQTPRLGYVNSLACDRCRAPARCQICTGPLAVFAAHLAPSCRWCGTTEQHWACSQCGGRGVRAPVLGEQRTAEELGRTFTSVPVRTSSGDRVLSSVRAQPSIVVATPGAEPVVEGGYACVVLLDTWLMLARADLRTTEESLRRWMNAAALARPSALGGRVVAVGDSAEPVLQALVRWDPAGFASREMAQRQSAHLPPASRLATLTGTEEAVTSALAMLRLPKTAEVLGPVLVDARPEAGSFEAHGPKAQVRVVVRVPRFLGSQLSDALRETSGLRAAKKMTAVRVQVDPVALG